MQIDLQDQQVDLLYGEKGPTAKQQLFRDCPASYRLYGGAVGGGKTVALCAEALRLSLAYPGNRGFMCRHESKAFKYTTLATMLRLIAKVEELGGAKILSNHHRTDQILYFINGSSIIYGALGEDEDRERIQSLEIGFFCIDEASETVYDNYLMLLSRLRWQLPNGNFPPFFGLLASNPAPGWVKDVYVKPAQLGEPLPNHAFIQALPSDNPFLPPDYIANLLASHPESWAKRFIEGSWDALEGQVWDMFSYDDHVIAPFQVPRGWTRVRGIDHGQSHPTVCLWGAVDPDGNIFIYREYYKPGIVSEHCRQINQMSEGPEGPEDYDYTLLPPECWGKTMEKQGELWSIYDEYTDHGIYPIAANNEVLAGINRVGEYLTILPHHIHPVKGTAGAPRLFIFSNCKNLILEIPDYSWKPFKTTEVGKERPRKVKDDAVDALRYLVMSRPSTQQLAAKAPFDSFMEVRQRHINAIKLAKRGQMDRHTAYDRLSRRLVSV